MVANASETGTGKRLNGHREAIVLAPRLLTEELKRARDPWSGRSTSTLEPLVRPGSQAKAYGATSGLFGLRGVLAGEDELKCPYVESWVFHACARWLADASASVPWQIFPSAKKDAKAVEETDPIAAFFLNPSPVMSTAQLKDAISVHLSESGESFLFLANRNAEPVSVNEETGEILELPAQVIPVSGLAVEERRDGFGRVTHWGFTAIGGTKQLVFPRAAVVQVKVYASSDPERGIGPAQVLARQLSMAFQFERYQEANARHGGPGGWLISEREMGTDEQDAAQVGIDEMMTDGKAPSTVKLLTGKGWSFMANPANPKQMLAIEMMQENVRVVCSTMRVPPPVIGRIEESRYANMAEARAEGWLGVANAEQRLADTLNAQFFRKLGGPVAKFKTYRIAPDLANVSALDIDESTRALAARTMSDGSGITLNSARGSLGLEPIDDEGADLAWIKAGYVPLEQALEGPPEPAPIAPPPSKDDAAKHGPALVRRIFDSIEPLGADERRAYSEGYIQRVFAPLERPLYKAVLTWRTNYKRAQLAQLEAFAAGDEKSLRVLRNIAPGDELSIAEQILLDQARWAKLLDTATRSTLSAAWDFSLSDAAAELGVLALPMSDPRIIEAFSNQMVKLTEGVTSRLAQNVKDSILETLRNSDSIGTLQERIKADLDAIKTSLNEGDGVFARNEARALNIARTETGHAASTARYLQFLAEGVEEIQWIDEEDDVVRESHAHKSGVGGEVVKLGTRFSNGLLHPHDPNGQAKEVCGCRCTFIAIIRKQERAVA